MQRIGKLDTILKMHYRPQKWIVNYPIMVLFPKSDNVLVGSAVHVRWSASTHLLSFPTVYDMPVHPHSLVLLHFETVTVVAISCGYGTCFAVKTCDGLCHFIFSIDRVGMPFGFQTIIWTFVRHPVSRCLTFPAFGVTWLLPVPTYGSTWVVLWLLFFRSAPSTFPSKQSTHRGPFPGVPSR